VLERAEARHRVERAERVPPDFERIHDPDIETIPAAGRRLSAGERHAGALRAQLPQIVEERAPAATEVEDAGAGPNGQTLGHVGVLAALRGRLGWNPAAIARGVAEARVGARLQRFGGEPELVVDVAHNPQAAGVLAQWLRRTPARGRTLAVFGALADKDVRGIVGAVARQVDRWYPAGLDRDSPRGLDAHALSGLLADLDDGHVATASADVEAALAAACADARPGDRVLAFGSFFVAAAALQFAARR